MYMGCLPPRKSILDVEKIKFSYLEDRGLRGLLNGGIGRQIGGAIEVKYNEEAIIRWL